MFGEMRRYREHYHHERKWSDKFLIPIARELGETFIVPAPAKEDMCQNTDLIVFKHRNHTYAARVRRHQYSKFKDDFTIRCGALGEGKTEFDKIMDGFGDYMFYGISNEDEDGFSCYSIIDLNVFRVHQEKIKGDLNENQDGTKFLAYKYDSFPKELIVIQRECMRLSH